ncbi:hypothetical protein [Chitinophaga pinensis]|uniref:Uncharacterized protein n=1 Tax=Chitinophaga pinensis TaxID=79329 RepID=A0A5C6LK35_9BACT|nr:hypothetical protein [Chitinophaga pinensis]TWV93268.1 hypothetical protein FEF09_27315 [Chitinophaga pinensis]
MSDAEIMLELEKPFPFDHTSVDTGKRAAALNVPEALTTQDAYIDNMVQPEVYAEMELEIASDPALQALAEQEKPETFTDIQPDGSRSFLSRPN